jgi:putative ABC transport system permease protein
LLSVFENITIALSAIRMNMLRTVLTIFIIGFGIMSLISMLTAVDGMKSALYSNFASVGSNTFSISNADELSGMRRRGMQVKQNPPIRYSEAAAFKKRFEQHALSSISFMASFDAVVQYQSVKTSPKTVVYGADENYLSISGMQVETGRNFLLQEINGGHKVAIIGTALKQDMFGTSQAIGKQLLLNNNSYTVIGVLQKKGSAFGQSQDNMVVIPVTAAQDQFISEGVSYGIKVQVKDIKKMDDAINEATGLFRIIRKLQLNRDNNFVVTKSDNVAQTLGKTISYVQIFAFIVGFITLLGASVGLTNIMLVSVKERTREIGVRKALGATFISIRNQFLWESVVITQLGGIFGILAGLLLGNIVASFISGSFIMPWLWIITGVIICIVVGIFAGLYPAIKAARLDPIESLRYE